MLTFVIEVQRIVLHAELARDPASIIVVRTLLVQVAEAVQFG